MRQDATPVALTIAGSDSSAGAGIQADLKTFAALEVYGASAITAVTAQSTVGVSAIHQVPSDIITAQIDSIFSDLSIAAIKTGMLGDEATIDTVSDRLRAWRKELPLVVDPVMVSTSGSRLLSAGAEEALKTRLIPLAALITPNLAEAAALSGLPVASDLSRMIVQAERLLTLGCKAVLVKGGHGGGAEAEDVFHDGVRPRVFSAPRLPTGNSHGTGCTLSAAICAFLVHGLPLEAAIGEAKTYVHRALARADDYNLGSGPGPVFHFHKWF